jgi:hypothetical protein
LRRNLDPQSAAAAAALLLLLLLLLVFCCGVVFSFGLRLWGERRSGAGRPTTVCFFIVNVVVAWSIRFGRSVAVFFTTGYVRQQAGELQERMKFLVAFLPSSYSGQIAVIRVESVHIFCLILS